MAVKNEISKYDQPLFPVLSLDIGKKRVGVAYMAELSSTADFKAILTRAGNSALESIITILNEKKVNSLVAGLPLNTLGEQTDQCQDIYSFCRRIERRFKIKVQFIDEYLTSQQAHSNNAKSAKFVDDQAAQIILIQFLKSKGLLPEYL